MNKNTETFLWHDYETFGVNPKIDRPAQFAAIRTDSEFNPIEDPIDIYCKPGLDVLPDPRACLITGITPQIAEDSGLSEFEFALKISEAFGQAGTCGVGYNSIRFDDEVTRHLFYRNFIDPYAREWKYGNSRWDLIDLLRACYALRPAGIKWPQNASGKPSFKLEELAKENAVTQNQAHNALSDVEATIGLAKLVQTQQPRLFEYGLTLRNKHTVKSLIKLSKRQPVVHVSARFPAERGCLAIVAPLAVDPHNSNAVICADLNQNPDEWLDLTEDEISDRLFCTADDLPEEENRPALKAIHINKSPFIAPINVLKGIDTKRIHLDIDKCLQHHRNIQNAPLPDFSKVFTQFSAETADVDMSLYSGGFIPGEDRQVMNQWLNLPLDDWTPSHQFKDERLNRLKWRILAKNAPHLCPKIELEKWHLDIKKKFHDPDLTAITWPDYPAFIQALKNQTKVSDHVILDNLIAWQDKLQQILQIQE